MCENNLYENCPHLREEWGGNIEEMKKYSRSSGKKVSWKCISGNPCHVWSAFINNRTDKNNPAGCPHCSGRKMCSCEKCPNLYNNFPQLRDEWDGDIEDMKTYSYGSNIKVSWKCKSNNPCHKWKSPISKRTDEDDFTGCPYCSGHKTCLCDSCPNLYNDYPELRDEWDGDIEKMKTYSCGSGEKVSWKCKSNNPCHKWKSTINSRTSRNGGCPYCLNKKICTCNDCPNLYNENPELRDEWDGDIEKMKTYASSSGKKVDWKCKSNNPCHKWSCSIDIRIRQELGCPYCSGHKTCSCDSCPNLYNDYPELRDEWDGDIEKMKTYSCGSGKKVNWKCKSNNPCHKWSSCVSDRTKSNPTGCPYCSGHKTCSCDICPNLYNSYPELRDEWDSHIEEMKTYASSSNKKVSWKCRSQNPCHKWESTVCDRTNGANNPTGCPYCSNRKTCSCEKCPNLYNNFPQLRDEWDADVEEMKTHPVSSSEKVSWKCKSGNHCHKWNAVINSRTKKTKPTGCPYCCISVQKVCSCEKCPNLYNNFPQLRDEWDGDLEEMKTYSFGSGKKVNWKCKTKKPHHVWISTIDSRTSKNNPSGCPFCINKTEAMLFDYLYHLNYTVEREKKYLWLEDKRRFDFVINNKTIIELDGIQHFEQVSNWENPENAQDNDIDKMNKALENGLNVIRIHQEDVYYDRIDWRNEIKEAVEYMEDKTGELKFINEVHYEHFQVQED